MAHHTFNIGLGWPSRRGVWNAIATGGVLYAYYTALQSSNTRAAGVTGKAGLLWRDKVIVV
jgi:hypothetical protein